MSYADKDIFFDDYVDGIELPDEEIDSDEIIIDEEIPF